MQLSEDSIHFHFTAMTCLPNIRVNSNINEWDNSLSCGVAFAIFPRVSKTGCMPMQNFFDESSTLSEHVHVKKSVLSFTFPRFPFQFPNFPSSLILYIHKMVVPLFTLSRIHHSFLCNTVWMKQLLKRKTFRLQQATVSRNDR